MNNSLHLHLSKGPTRPNSVGFGDILSLILSAQPNWVGVGDILSLILTFAPFFSCREQGVQNCGLSQLYRGLVRELL